MISTDLRHLADWVERNADILATPAQQFITLGLAQHLAELADQAQALEHAVLAPHARQFEVPPGCIDLAAHRASRALRFLARPIHPTDGGTAA